MKEIVGVSRPHLVEDFLLSLQSNMAVSLESSSVMEIPQVKSFSIRYVHVH